MVNISLKGHNSWQECARDLLSFLTDSDIYALQHGRAKGHMKWHGGPHLARGPCVWHLWCRPVVPNQSTAVDRSPAWCLSVDREEMSGRRRKKSPPRTTLCSVSDPSKSQLCYCSARDGDTSPVYTAVLQYQNSGSTTSFQVQYLLRQSGRELVNLFCCALE